jgi:hypothetical protein
MIGATTRWIADNYSRVEKAALDNVGYRLVLRMDRNMLRTNASTFMDIRKHEDASNFTNLTMLLFLEMIERVNNSVKEDPDCVHHYPFVKMYLEWVPSANNPDRACEYRLHAFFTQTDAEEGINCGKTLQVLLNENEAMARESANSSGKGRKVDSLQNLKAHQMWRRVSKEQYLRVVCGLARGDSYISNNLDAFLSHGNPLSLNSNAAHPGNIFTLEHCIRHTAKRYPNVHKKYQSVKAYCLNGIHDFPDYSKVWRLTPGQCAPHTFIKKFIPDYQAYNDAHHPPPMRKLDIPEPVEDEDEQTAEHKDAGPMIPLLQADKPASPESRFDNAQMSEYDLRDAAQLEQDRISAFTTRGDFHVMHDISKAYYRERVAPHEGQPAWKEAYTEFQEWCIEEVKARCFTPDSNVSPMIRRICKWGERHTPVDTTYNPVDPTLSPFANRVIRIMEELEQFALIATVHLHYYVILHARYDAYRRAMDKVKMNTFFFGEGAAGKSFMFKLLAMDSIPDTVVELTYQTGKADAIDGNRNGEITVMHEVPPTMFRSKVMGRNADKSEESRWKDKLTRQKVTVKTFYQDEETGKRMNRTAESECGGVWFGACNQTADDIEEALATRFLKVTCETTQRPDKDISDCQNAERKMDPITKEQRSYIHKCRQEEQYRMCIIEHYIWMGAIKDVDETAYHVTIGQFKQDVRKMREDFKPRDFERIRIFSRVQAICTAIDIVYNLPGGELYGQPFREEDLPILEPYLVITEEHVLFSISLMSYMFISNTEHKAFHTVYKMFKHGNKDRAYLLKDNVNNYNYLKLGTLNSVVTEIYSKLPLRGGRVSTEEIRALIISLGKRHISSREYRKELGQNEAVEDQSGRPRSHQVAIFTKEGVHIHMKYIEQFHRSDVDPIRDIIERMTHKHARNKRMLIARSIKHSWHILRTFNRAPNDQPITERNVLYNSEASRAILGIDTVAACRRVQSYKYTKDLDDDAYERRCRTLQVECIEPQLIHQRIHEHDGPTISYPADLTSTLPPTSPVERIEEPASRRLVDTTPSVAPAPRKMSQTMLIPARQGYRDFHKRQAEDELSNASKRPRNQPIEPGPNAMEMR